MAEKDIYQADVYRLAVIGHSNGGHGAWWIASHFPDRIMACLPASGYMKVQMYIPYYMHIGYSYIDPVIRGLLEGSISENDIDLYASNLVGVPVLARSGQLDKTIPPLHSRRLVRIVKEWSRDINSIEYIRDNIDIRRMLGKDTGMTAC